MPIQTAVFSLTRIEFWAGAMLLTATLVMTAYSLFRQHQQAKRLGQMELIVRDTQEIRDALRKPCEGIWEYFLDYSRFHGPAGSWQANGKAVLLWRPGKSQYDVYIGANVTEMNNTTEVLVTFVLEGTLLTDASGWPRSNSSFQLSYLARKGASKHQEPSNPRCSYDTLSVTNSPDGLRVVQICARFKTHKTEGKVCFRNPK